MFRGMFGARSERSDYSDVVGITSFGLRARDHVFLAIMAVISAIMVLGLPASTSGVVSEIGADGRPLYDNTDLSAVPESVSGDAARLAAQMFGRDGKKSARFVDELLATHVRAQDKDVVVLFSPGGWGHGPMDTQRPWGSILNGMESQLSDSGIDFAILTYQRSVNSLYGCFEEMTEILRGYQSKARIMASRVQFLTEHNPNLKVVIVGESTGAQLGGQAADILSHNPQVFGIQIGPPCWYHHADTLRMLVISDNGIVADSFSRGDVLTIITANLSALFGESQAGGDRGTILKYLRAPGHDYWWDYPGVSSQITRFFEENIGIGKSG